MTVGFRVGAQSPGFHVIMKVTIITECIAKALNCLQDWIKPEAAYGNLKGKEMTRVQRVEKR